MEAKLVVLKLFLDALDIPADIQTIDDRKRIQKAVYLGQLTRVDLGYRFGWYVMGPYSPSLTRDYYKLAEDLQSGDRGYEGKKLRSAVLDRLRRIRPLLKVPDGLELSQEEWLELVASYHYLVKVSKQPRAEAMETLEKQKPHLRPFVERAQEALGAVGLI